MTHQTILADRFCGMNTQAAELLARMSTEMITLDQGMSISTYPYCNCREMGFVVSVYSSGRDRINVAFYEHRNSDQLCALKWTGNLPISGAVTANDVPEVVFPDKWSVTAQWKCGNYGEAIEYLMEVIEAIKVENAEKRDTAV